jgi:hypothetical protein
VVSVRLRGGLVDVKSFAEGTGRVASRLLIGANFHTRVRTLLHNGGGGLRCCHFASRLCSHWAIAILPGNCLLIFAVKALVFELVVHGEEHVAGILAH